MGLERRLTDEEAEAIFEKKRIMLKAIGIKERNLVFHLAESKKEYENYKKVHQLIKNHNSREVSEKLGLPFTTIESWTRLEEIPLLLAKPGYFSKKKREIRENRNNDLAFLLGIYAGSKKNPRTNSFGISFKEENLIQKVAGSVYHLTSLLPQVHSSKRGWTFHYFSDKLADFFQKHTLDNTVIPWQLFDGDESKRAYLRGFLSTKSSVTSNADNYQPGISIDLSRNKSLINEMGILFSDLGIYPSLTKIRVNVTHPLDLKNISDSGLLLEERKKERLEQILSGFDFSEEEISVEKFLEIRGRLKSGQYNRKKTREAFVANGANYYTAREWVSTNKKPKRVKRYLKLRKIKQDVGDSNAISYLYGTLKYRGWKTGVERSRRLAKMFTLDEVKEYQTRRELENDAKNLNLFLYLREKLELDWNSSKSLVKDFSKQELEQILYGDIVYKTTTKDIFIGKANLTFWRKYMAEGRKYFFEDSEQKEPRDLVNLSYFFNMFVPENYVDDAESLTRAYRLFYRKIMAHPASSSFVRIENSQFYVINNPRYLNLTETLLGGAGLGGKKRRFDDAKKLTEKLGL